MPPLLKVQQNVSCLAFMAEALLQMGELVEWDNDPKKAVDAAVASWLQRQLHGISFLDHVSFCFTNNLEGCSSNLDVAGDAPEGALALSIDNCASNPYALRRSLATRMEKECPGLAAPVFQILELALDCGVGCIGPLGALGVAVGEHWRGEDDEKMVQEEYVQEHRDHYGDEVKDKTDAEILQDVEWFTRADFHKEIPRWLTHPYYFRRDQSHRRTLKALAPKAPQFKALIDLALEVDTAAAWSLNEAHRSINRWHCMEPIILFWKPWGVVAKLYDDKGQYVIDNGIDHNVAALTHFHPLKVKEIRNAFRKMSRLFDGMRAADRLLKKLATRLTRPATP